MPRESPKWYNNIVDNKQLVKDFLKKQKHMVLATVTNDIPEAALVGFAEMDNLNLIFGTETTSRKFQNIQNNSKIAAVFTDGDISIQYEGIVSVLIGHEIEEYKQKYFEKLPEAKKYDSEPNQIYLKIIPTWIRYVDYSKETPDIFEVQL